MISRQPWGSAGGQPVELFTLSSGAGMTVRICSFGGVVQSVSVPDRSGRAVNVALGFASLDEYVENVAGPAVAFFGAIIGRVANRIGAGGFALDGRRYELRGGSGAGGGSGDGVILHGGPGGYHTRVWEPLCSEGVLRLSYVDPAGTNGFPGTVANDVVYAVTPDNALRISYQATCDAPTVVNLTNHTYFNLAGEGSGDVYGQRLALNAGAFLLVDEAQIPVGFAGVAGTPFDFRAMKPIGRDIRAVDEQLRLAGGYDHNWVLAGAGYELAAVAYDPGTGIVLWAYTDQPGVQMYTANHLSGGLVGTSGRAYGPGHAFALETQGFPDAPNHIGESGWPSVALRPGQVLRTRTTYRFGVAGPGLAERIRF